MNSLFTRFLRHPGQVGALCPSSRSLAIEMTRGIGMETARTVVELGPGTGAITSEIIPRLRENAGFLTVELDPGMAESLRGRFPRARVVCGSASDLPDILKASDTPCADVILSGLPWAVFPTQLQDEILDGVFAGLASGGAFATFAYIQGVILPGGIRFRRRLESLFREVSCSPIVWRNLPPAFVYRCRK
ncbi:MAG: methyltransferase domain-containing protein [Lentisphaeria bacterium]|nr:methyltransferase domain-containing protein [Lentisphaeria bacterium]